MTLTTFQRDTWIARETAERALAAALEKTGTALDADRRCARPELNLVRTITPDRWTDIRVQLGRGNGGELLPTAGKRPKFCSAFSSCALAVNSFGPFDETRTLVLPDIGSYRGRIEFEAQRSAGVPGFKPNLDLVTEPDKKRLAVCREQVLGVPASARHQLQRRVRENGKAVAHHRDGPVLPRFAAAKADGHDRYQLLDAAQLPKHYLAAKIAANDQRLVTLAYLFWEPAGIAAHEISSAHRCEADDLAAALRRRARRFRVTDERMLLEQLDVVRTATALAAGEIVARDRDGSFLEKTLRDALATRPPRAATEQTLNPDRDMWPGQLGGVDVLYVADDGTRVGVETKVWDVADSLYDIVKLAAGTQSRKLAVGFCVIAGRSRDRRAESAIRGISESTRTADWDVATVLQDHARSWGRIWSRTAVRPLELPRRLRTCAAEPIAMPRVPDHEIRLIGVQAVGQRRLTLDQSGLPIASSAPDDA